MKREVSCGCIIIKDDKVLLVQNIKGKHWSFPKGHMEDGETEKETAIREVKEETNIDVKIIDDKKYTITYRPNPNVIKDVHFFSARPVNKEYRRQEKEISIVEYFTFKDALELITHDDLKELFKQFLKEHELDIHS